MTWIEILQLVVFAIVTWLGAEKGQSLRFERKEMVEKSDLLAVKELIKDVVKAVKQTIVKAKKDDGEVSKEERKAIMKKAKEIALQEVKEFLTPERKARIMKRLKAGEEKLEKYLDSLIEAQVREDKDKDASA